MGVKCKYEGKAQQVIGTCLGLVLIPVLIGVRMLLQEKHDEKWQETLYKMG